MHLVIPGSRYSLAYKIPVTIIVPDFETFHYYVDANSGAILKIRPTHIDVTADVYGYGNRNIDTKWRGGFIQKYELDAEDDTHNIHTKKYTTPFQTWDNMPDTRSSASNWGSTYLTETSTHFHVTNTWDYFRNVFGRTGQNNAGREIHVMTQWNNANAYFESGNNYNNLVFGKKNAWDWGMEPSIVAHEFTHGVTHHTAGLIYQYETGAINESFSDIFGIVIQATTLDADLTDWILGNFIPYAPTRSLKDPNSMGIHFDASGNQQTGQPDTYNGTYWYTGSLDNGGVHINSGVQNKWFHVLAHGDDGYNDLSNYYHVNGIGMTKAAKIAYYALTSVLLPSSQYSDSRQATVSAAKILYGECSVEHQATIDAWYAVGIGSVNNCSFTASLNEIAPEDVSAFPNPANTVVTFDLPAIADGPIRIMDISGNLVKELKSDLLFFQTDISGFANGIYFVNFNFKSNQVVKRIIVQK
jgi:Zn-dependent metalloprotease